MIGLEESFAECARIVNGSGSNFPVAFRLLSRAQHQAMNALYAYLRLTDDLGDGPGDFSKKRHTLADWRAATMAAWSGEFTHPIHPALHAITQDYAIPHAVLLAPIEGVEQDLKDVAIATETDLAAYCDKVAGAVGLACLKIWGCDSPDVEPLAQAAGRAFQRTNILRDIAEDAKLGRVYIPSESWRKHQCPPETWMAGHPGSHFQELITEHILLARKDFAKAEGLLVKIPRPGRAVYWLMLRTYSAILDRVETLGPKILTTRARVPKWRKAFLFARAWAKRYLYA
jgi:phytoene synthase